MPFTGVDPSALGQEVDLDVDPAGDGLEVDPAGDILVVTPAVTWTGQTASETL